MAKRLKVPHGKQRVRVETGIYLKANGKYIATFRDPGRTQHWKESKTLSEARRWRSQGLIDPRSLASGKRSLREVWSTFMGYHGAGLRRTTKLNWEQQWRKHIEPRLGGWPVGKITIPAVKTFLADLERAGVGPATRAKCRSILHRLLEDAFENGEIPSNPAAAAGTRVKQPQRKRARSLTPAEVQKVLNAAASQVDDSTALAIETMCLLGLRFGELAGLQARDFDWDGLELTVQRTVSDAGGRLEVVNATKTNEYRVLPLPDSLPTVDRLRAHIRERGLIGKAHVFQSVGGGPLRPNNWRRRVWMKIMIAARIQNPPTPHGGRRTASSLLSEAGVPPATIQAILGHSTLQQTGEYITVPREAMKAGLETLGGLYRNGASQGAPV
jgi:integrase